MQNKVYFLIQIPINKTIYFKTVSFIFYINNDNYLIKISSPIFNQLNQRRKNFFNSTSTKNIVNMINA